MNEKIKLENLTMIYPNSEKGVFDINITIKPGQIFGFMGPSGSGKTTLIRIILGFIKQQQGNALINGHEIWNNIELVNGTISYISGEPIIPNEGTGLSYLQFYAKLREIKDLTRMYQLIDYFELDAKSLIKKMSKGMKQKVAIIACLMGDFDIYVLDEPTAGLDPVMQAKFLETILEMKNQGKTIILSSHIMDEVEKLCDQVLILKKGHIMFNDTMQSIVEQNIKLEKIFWEIYNVKGFNETINYKN
ncbi:ABC transporter ATP-binding protein [Williamsoniiplasma lucivorax]|uniref:ABC transporter ATP-binding protein n=1 Tax=Williamsoniiplasma lucivorax TaxID=209274 RepID=A0A2S5RDY4_9MOLU|nr:ABC transporter ATP-binding protein [Williamsoniiplasma lucivorax]PPE05514.1 ABC transporter ATP-binding protein [Williamsoniiplasma lucivorax]